MNGMVNGMVSVEEKLEEILKLALDAEARIEEMRARAKEFGIAPRENSMLHDIARRAMNALKEAEDAQCIAERSVLAWAWRPWTPETKEKARRAGLVAAYNSLVKNDYSSRLKRPEGA